MTIKFHFNLPAMFPGYRLVAESRSLEFTGWAFGNNATCAISVVLDGTLYPSHIEAKGPLLGVAAAFPDVPHAIDAGFRLLVVLPDDADHDLVVNFGSGDVIGKQSIRIFRKPPPDIPYVSPNTVADLYKMIIGQIPTPGELNIIMRQGSNLLFNREDYIQKICSTQKFRGQLLHSDVFARFTEIEFKGCLFRLPEQDHITRRIVASGRYEPYVMDYMLSCLSKDSAFLDIGANVGLFAVTAGKIVGPGGKVYAVEALSRNAKIIAINAELNGLTNLHILPLGAAEHAGANFWFRQNGSSNNSISDMPRLADRSFDDFDLVAVVPLDALIPTSERIDVIKIDIEGRELQGVPGRDGHNQIQPPNHILRIQC